MKRFLLLILALATLACARDEEAPASNTQTAAITYEQTLPSDVQWLNTTVQMKLGQRIRIEPTPGHEDEALGLKDANFKAPVPTAGTFALIAKLGENGLPVAVGKGVQLQSSSLTANQYIFVGRNGKPSDFASPQTHDATEDVTAPARAELSDIPFRIIIEPTSAPAPLAPVTGFFTSNVSPTFDWDDAEDAFKYVFELSLYPDFRDLILNIEPTGSSVSLSALSADNNQPTLPGQTETPKASLREGVYYWRVRAQVNHCRTIAPCLDWTDHSVVSHLGVEAKSALPAPRILSPRDQERIPAGKPVLIEFTQPPDASGLFWRYLGYAADCAAVINGNNSQPKFVSGWKVFLGEYETNFIGELPQKYGAVVLRDLAPGSYLYRIQVVDGADGQALNLARSGIADVAFKVGCQN